MSSIEGFKWGTAKSLGGGVTFVPVKGQYFFKVGEAGRATADQGPVLERLARIKTDMHLEPNKYGDDSKRTLSLSLHDDELAQHKATETALRKSLVDKGLLNATAVWTDFADEAYGCVRPKLVMSGKDATKVNRQVTASKLKVSGLKALERGAYVWAHLQLTGAWYNTREGKAGLSVKVLAVVVVTVNEDDLTKPVDINKMLMDDGFEIVSGDDDSSADSDDDDGDAAAPVSDAAPVVRKRKASDDRPPVKKKKKINMAAL